MIYFSNILFQHPAAFGVISSLDVHNIPYRFLFGTKDIWLRDFMPVRTGSRQLISFRYEPNYLSDEPNLRTDFRRDIAPQLGLPVTYSDINLDGGNVVYSPSRRRVIISDRVYTENPAYTPAVLVSELEALLEAEVIIIPSLKSDMTGHADGMVRFVDEDTVIGNDISSIDGLEQHIKRVLRGHSIHVVDFPYQADRGISAVGCYLNFFETERCIFLPIFGVDMDDKAILAAQQIFHKEIVPVNIRGIARQGGCLNCISWEFTE